MLDTKIAWETNEDGSFTYTKSTLYQGLEIVRQTYDSYEKKLPEYYDFLQIVPHGGDYKKFLKMHPLLTGENGQKPLCPVSKETLIHYLQIETDRGAPEIARIVRKKLKNILTIEFPDVPRGYIELNRGEIYPDKTRNVFDFSMQEEYRNIKKFCEKIHSICLAIIRTEGVRKLHPVYGILFDNHTMDAFNPRIDVTLTPHSVQRYVNARIKIPGKEEDRILRPQVNLILSRQNEHSIAHPLFEEILVINLLKAGYEVSKNFPYYLLETYMADEYMRDKPGRGKCICVDFSVGALSSLSSYDSHYNDCWPELDPELVEKAGTAISETGQIVRQLQRNNPKVLTPV